MKIAILEDDSEQAGLLHQWLAGDDYRVTHSQSCADFLTAFVKDAPDMVVLDWELPDGSGIDVLESLRNKFQSSVPVLFTTQRDTEEDIVNALKIGADDYLVKPLRYGEFIARLTALRRRAGLDQSQDKIEEGPYVIDIQAEEISLDGEILKLTNKDFLVALCLFQNIGKPLSREFFLKEVWSVEAGLDTRTVDMHVSRVRRSLKLGPDRGLIIKTIYQHGYRLEKIS